MKYLLSNVPPADLDREGAILDMISIQDLLGPLFRRGETVSGGAGAGLMAEAGPVGADRIHTQLIGHALCRQQPGIKDHRTSTGL